jgi:hypothetical protein
LTVAGLEEVEWSIMNPLHGTADRAPWFATWLYVVEVLTPLDTATLRWLFHTLSEYAEAPDIDSRVEAIAGNDVGGAFRRLMSDPALQGAAAVVSILLTIIGLMLSLRTDQPTFEIRPTIILEQAARDQLDRGASGASHEDTSDDVDPDDHSPEGSP